MIALSDFIIEYLTKQLTPYENGKDSRVKSLKDFISLYEPKKFEDKNWGYLILRLEELANDHIDKFRLNLRSPLATKCNIIKRGGLISEGQAERLDKVVKIACEHFDYLSIKHSIEREKEIKETKDNRRKPAKTN